MSLFPTLFKPFATFLMQHWSPVGPALMHWLWGMKMDKLNQAL
jgi:hypothetical protein